MYVCTRFPDAGRKGGGGGLATTTTESRILSSRSTTPSSLISSEFDSMNDDNMPPTLLQFLKQSRTLHVQHLAGSSSAPPPIYVLGNPSADLDSIISAIIYSYFASGNGHHHHHLQQLAQSSIPAGTTTTRPKPKPKTRPRPRPHIPLINLAEVRSGPELWRLRPEFVTALWLSTSDPPVTKNEIGSEEGEEGEGDTSEKWDHRNVQAAGKFLSEHVLTLADLRAQIQFGEREDRLERSFCLLTTMVDWNAFPVRLLPSSKPWVDPEKQQRELKGIGSLGSSLPGVELHVVGCIDHHEDEGFVPSPSSLSEDQPCVIQTGPGSCMSLVVRELRSGGLWFGGDDATDDLANTEVFTSTSSSESDSLVLYEAQAAKLALAAILIDTTNLTAKGKVTDIDRQAVSFLEAKIHESSTLQQQQQQQQQEQKQTWDRNSFFQIVSETKQNSLDLLTLPEVLDRDYKDWTETITTTSPPSRTIGEAGNKVKLGFCSSVKPIEWIINKATPNPESTTNSNNNLNKPQAFMNALQTFSSSRNLDVIVIMTAFVDNTNNKFRRELLLCALHPGPAEESTKSFASRAESELRLSSWSPSPSSSVLLGNNSATTGEGKGKDLLSSVLNTDSPLWCRVWEQGDVTKSRKQVAPLLRKVVATL